MVLYEVTAAVEENLRERYESYMLDRHIPDMLETGYFTDASFETSEPGIYRARFSSASHDALEGYFTESAPTIRANFSEKFPSGIEIRREVWTVVARLP